MAAAAGVLVGAAGLHAQAPAGALPGGLRPTAQAILLGTLTDPIPGGGRLGEVRVVQPVLGVTGDWFAGRLRVHGMLNLEGLTLRHGELGLGLWGEGFVDRRHPHTYFHELMVAVTSHPDRAWQAGLYLGKGFVPFGTDDPMSRPVVRYPVNHHWAQVLERAVVGAQVRWAALTLEAAAFNGDEPERPGQWPRLSRFGDSWSVRGLGRAGAGVELQVSRARVHSPEHREGSGLDQGKWSASIRMERHLAGREAYALVEWARTTEASGAFVFTSVLAEGALRVGRVRPHYRFERTERPEEERVAPFRSARPHHEDAILGGSRWTTHTAGAGLRVGRHLEPLVEATVGRIAKARPGVFDVDSWYRRDRFWSLSAGVRVTLGAAPHRMGRYGVLAEPEHH